METLISDLYFKPVITERELKACYAMRYKVYCEQKRWLPASRYPDGLEFDEYDEKATHIIAMDEDFNFIGSTRILDGKNYNKLPYMKHPSMKNSNYDVPNQIEFSRFIITATKNRYQVIRGLLRVFYHLCKENNWETWFIMVENSFIKYMERFQLYWEPVEVAAKYFGAITVPAKCTLKSTEKIWYTKFPETYEFFNKDYHTYQDHKELVV